MQYSDVTLIIMKLYILGSVEVTALFVLLMPLINRHLCYNSAQRITLPNIFQWNECKTCTMQKARNDILLLMASRTTRLSEEVHSRVKRLPSNGKVEHLSQLTWRGKEELDWKQHDECCSQLSPCTRCVNLRERDRLIAVFLFVIRRHVYLKIRCNWIIR